jgi:hypothetical protein
MFGINPWSSAPFVTTSKENLVTFILNNKPTISLFKSIFRLLSIVSTSTAIFWKGYFILLTNLSICGIILRKTVNRLFSIISSNTISLLTVVISFVNFITNKVVYARSIVKEITSIKFRTLFIKKDNKV